MQQTVYEVSQINEYLRLRFEEDDFLSEILLRGEISNYKLYPSGHHYFSLKDAGGAIRCVMFRGSAVRLRFRPENGMKVIAGGRISVYPRDGIYQLYCNSLAPDGIGDLHIAFEQLKQRLQAEGLFSLDRKKPLPRYPQTIAIITSSAGAALQDMLRILRKRYPLTKVKLLAVRVQGAEAPSEIAAAIAYANRFHVADLIITGRGGGSIEDLWAFNDERVAYAIANSEIPVISAVGHEPDVTISDFVADLRAATPSNAAELAVPDQTELREALSAKSAMLRTLMTRRLRQERQRVDALARSRSLRDPCAYLNDRRLRLDYMQQRLSAAATNIVSRRRERFVRLTAKLDAMSPLRVLGRGYTLVQNREKRVIKSIKDISAGDTVSISLADGRADAVIQEVSEWKKK